MGGEEFKIHFGQFTLTVDPFDFVEKVDDGEDPITYMSDEAVKYRRRFTEEPASSEEEASPAVSNESYMTDSPQVKPRRSSPARRSSPGDRKRKRLARKRRFSDGSSPKQFSRKSSPYQRGSPRLSSSTSPPHKPLFSN